LSSLFLLDDERCTGGLRHIYMMQEHVVRLVLYPCATLHSILHVLMM
jgi:hypothetical protein